MRISGGKRENCGNVLLSLAEEIRKGKGVDSGGVAFVSLPLPLGLDDPSAAFCSLDWGDAGGDAGDVDGWLVEGELDFRSWYRRTLLTVGHFSFDRRTSFLRSSDSTRSLMS